MSPFTRGFAPNGQSQSAAVAPSNPLLQAPNKPLTDPLTALYQWISDVHQLVTPLLHNDNAVCIMSIIKEIADCEMDGYDAMIAKGKDLCPDFYFFLRLLVKESTVLTGRDLQKVADEVFAGSVFKPTVAAPKPKPLPAVNPLLVSPVTPPEQRALL